MESTSSDTEIHLHLIGLLSCLVGLIYGVVNQLSILWIASLLVGVIWLVFAVSRFRLDIGLELTTRRILTSGVFVILAAVLSLVFKIRLDWDSSVSIMVAAVATASVYWMFFTLEPDRGSDSHT